VFDLTTSNDLTLILGHGCYNSKKLMRLVKDNNSFVDTSQGKPNIIMRWVNNGLEDNLVFGSDCPCSDTGRREFDWNAQEGELNKLKELGLTQIINKSMKI